MRRHWLAIGTLTTLALLGVTALAGAGDSAPRGRPLITRFGLGPNRSHGGRYVATIETDGPLTVGRMQTVRLRLTDSAGVALDSVTIGISGGMPAHGHGLPTAPRVTRALGNGGYEIGGVKFSMRGWWKLRFLLDGPAGRDSVYFGLEL